MKQTTDLDVAALLARSGDRAALDQLAEFTYRHGRAYLRRTFHGVDEDALYHALVDVASALLEGKLLRRWSPARGDFVPWLNAVLVNAARDALAADARRAREEPHDSVEIGNSAYSSEPGPERHFAARQALNLIWPILTPRERMVAELLACGHSIPEVARQAGITVRSLRALQRRMKSKVKAFSEREEIDVAGPILGTEPMQLHSVPEGADDGEEVDDYCARTFRWLP